MPHSISQDAVQKSVWIFCEKCIFLDSISWSGAKKIGKSHFQCALLCALDLIFWTVKCSAHFFVQIKKAPFETENGRFRLSDLFCIETWRELNLPMQGSCKRSYAMPQCVMAPELVVAICGMGFKGTLYITPKLKQHVTVHNI